MLYIIYYILYNIAAALAVDREFVNIFPFARPLPTPTSQSCSRADGSAVGTSRSRSRADGSAVGTLRGPFGDPLGYPVAGVAIWQPSAFFAPKGVPTWRPNKHRT